MATIGRVRKITYMNRSDKKGLKILGDNRKVNAIQIKRLNSIVEHIDTNYMRSVIAYIIYDYYGVGDDSDPVVEIDQSQMLSIYKDFKEYRKEKGPGTALKEAFEPPEFVESLVSRYTGQKYDEILYDFRNLKICDQKELLEEMDAFIDLWENKITEADKHSNCNISFELI